MDWFERLTGFAEADYATTRARLRVADGRLHSDASPHSHGIGALELVSLADLRARAAEAAGVAGVTVAPGATGMGVTGAAKGAVTAAPTLGILRGDVRRLHAAPENAGAVFQVASQFNLLEMVGPDITPEQGVTRYAGDPTQGPACAIAAGAGTIYRNYLVPVAGHTGQTADRQLDGLAELGRALAEQMGMAPGTLWRMRNGYALPEAATLVRIEDHLAALPPDARDRLRGLLRVGLHADVEVTEPGAPPGTQVTQVYCSALPVRYGGIRAPRWRHFASLVLEAAYEATLLAGVLTAARGGSRRVLLTRLGGGAFGNADAWIDAAILRALERVRGHGLEVWMVSHGAPPPAMQAILADWRARAGETDPHQPVPSSETDCRARAGEMGGKGPTGDCGG